MNYCWIVEREKRTYLEKAIVGDKRDCRMLLDVEQATNGCR